MREGILTPSRQKAVVLSKGIQTEVNIPNFFVHQEDHLRLNIPREYCIANMGYRN